MLLFGIQNLGVGRRLATGPEQWGDPYPRYLGISPNMGHIGPKSTGKGTLSYTEICVCMVATV